MVSAQVSGGGKGSFGGSRGPMLVGGFGDHRPPVDITVSFASGDWRRKEQLLELLAPRLYYRPEYRFDLWVANKSLLLGQDWDRAIMEAFRTWRCSIALLSPNWLCSPYVQGKEWPAMVNRVLLPVGLVWVDLDHGDLHPPHLRPGDPPINQKQIFTQHHQNELKFFGSMRTTIDREKWVDGLVKEIIKRLNHEHGINQRSRSVA